MSKWWILNGGGVTTVPAGGSVLFISLISCISFGYTISYERGDGNHSQHFFFFFYLSASQNIQMKLLTDPV